MTKTYKISQEALNAVKKAGYVSPSQARSHWEDDAKAEAHRILGAEILLEKAHSEDVEVKVPLAIVLEFHATYKEYNRLMNERTAIHPVNRPDLSLEDYDEQIAKLDEQTIPVRMKLYELESVLVSVVQAQM